jgi:hypothetical protein
MSTKRERQREAREADLAAFRAREALRETDPVRYEKETREWGEALRKRNEYAMAGFRAAQQAGETKIETLRRELEQYGSLYVLRQIVSGADALNLGDQMRIALLLEREVAFAKRRARPKKRKRKLRNPRIAKLEAMAADEAATDGERAAAREAIKRLNGGTQ